MAKAAGSTLLPFFHTEWEDDMPESVYDVVLLIGSSKESWEKCCRQRGRTSFQISPQSSRRRNRRTRYATGREGKGGSLSREGQAIVQSRALKTKSTPALDLIARAGERIEMGSNGDSGEATRAGELDGHPPDALPVRAAIRIIRYTEGNYDDRGHQKRAVFNNHNIAGWSARWSNGRLGVAQRHNARRRVRPLSFWQLS